MFRTTRGLILREAKYSEADKMLTVLTQDEGKQSVAAKGVRGKSGRLSAACQLLSFSELTLYESRGRLYVREASTVEQFLGLREDISKLALGMYFAELLEAVSDEDSPNSAVLSLGLNSLFALSRGLYPPEHIKAVFELRLMCLAGFEPALDGCMICGEPFPQRPCFSIYEGGLVCDSCVSGARKMSPGALEAVRHIVTAPPKRIFAFSLDEQGERELAWTAESFVAAQLEGKFPSLDYWKKVKTN